MTNLSDRTGGWRIHHGRWLRGGFPSYRGDRLHMGVSSGLRHSHPSQGPKRLTQLPPRPFICSRTRYNLRGG